jgi:uncharacterized membrane protein YkgB
VFFAFLPADDMIIALKLLIVVVWCGAGVSKFGRHFTNVVPPMVSNTPFFMPKFVKRMHYRDYPNDLRPSKLASLMAHGGGSFVELVTPLVLLFSVNPTLTLCAVVLMVVFHGFILSTFPLAVPLEWNVLFGFAAVFLFWLHPAWDGYGVWDMSSPWLAIGIVACLVFFPILGNLRPDLVSFLPAMRQYAGNWASATWALAPGAEAKLDELVFRPCKNQLTQLQATYPPVVAEITMQQTIGWRSMHSQGRGLLSLIIKHLGDDIDRYDVREAEFGCNSVIGFNFGDGHLHDEQLIEALQEQCHFAPGEFIVAWVESQAIHPELPEIQGDRRRAGDHRAGSLEGSRRGQRAALAAQRTHPAAGRVDRRAGPGGASGCARHGFGQRLRERGGERRGTGPAGRPGRGRRGNGDDRLIAAARRPTRPALSASLPTNADSRPDRSGQGRRSSGPTGSGDNPGPATVATGSCVTVAGQPTVARREVPRRRAVLHAVPGHPQWG